MIGFRDASGRPMIAVEALFSYLDPDGGGYLPFESDGPSILIRPCPLGGHESDGDEFGCVVGCMWIGPADVPVGLTREILRSMGYWRPPYLIDYLPWRLRMVGGDGHGDLVYYIREEFYPVGEVQARVLIPRP